MMDWFELIWLGAVVLGGYWSASRGWHEWQTGVASYYFRYHFPRNERPRTYWFLILGRILGVIFAIGLFIFGLRFEGYI
jgi:hypothetical protein